MDLEHGFQSPWLKLQNSSRTSLRRTRQRRARVPFSGATTPSSRARNDAGSRCNWKRAALAFKAPAPQSLDVCGDNQPRLQWQFEGEYRTVPHLAGYADGAAMGFDDGFRDG
jgi:hypothetical protein